MDAESPIASPRHRLLIEPTEAQKHLLDVVWHVYGTTGRWPIYQYVEAILYKERGGLDARAVLLDCPWLLYGRGLAHYGWLWVADANLNNANLGAPQPGDTIGLTVVGMSRVPEAAEELGLFLGALRVLVGQERSFRPSPTTVQNVDLKDSDVRERLLPPGSGWHGPLNPLARLGEILRREPSTRRYVSSPFGTMSWEARLDSFIRRYEGVSTVEEYADRLTEEISPPVPQPLPALESSLAVPEALDYLNIVWGEKAHQPLFVFRRAEAAAKLAFECNSADELDSRLSALCDLLSHLRLPGADDESKLVAVQDFLARRLPDDGVPRATDAVTDLRALFDVRAWRQHSGGDAERKARRAMRRLRLELPAADWGVVWDRVQAVTVAALNAIREEVERVDVLAPLGEPSTAEGESIGR